MKDILAETEHDRLHVIGILYESLEQVKNMVQESRLMAAQAEVNGFYTRFCTKICESESLSLKLN